MSGAFQQLNESELSIQEQLLEQIRSLNQIAKFDSKVEDLTKKIEGIQLELEEIGNEFEEIGEATEYSPERIQETTERLDLIYKLQKKHNVRTTSELLDIQTDIKNRLSGFSDLSTEIERLEKEIAAIKTELENQAKVLSDKRKSVIPSFEKKIHAMLTELSMASARLEIQILDLETLSPTGLDEVNYLFSANKGGRLQNIKDVASGGEQSRLTLVTKSLVASSIPLPTLIFDEIDSGVSGDVAIRMGDILRKLSREHQVVVITHSPQVASKADAHYFVYKKETETRTLTKVKQLSEDEKIRAIAIMLSQNPPSDAALENAKGLLEMA